MPNHIDINNSDSVNGAVYFVVGRGTEGGPSSYRLSVAGVTDDTWGQTSKVAANSGYSIGTIQVDLGQRGTWPLGATSNRSLKEGEQSYVDAIIEQSSSYAEKNNLKFTDDLDTLRSNLLSHGNGGKVGERTRTKISFIDTDTRDSINTWASSDEGKEWIHENIDLAQVKNATEIATSIVNKHGSNVPNDKKFEVVAIIAKTANQIPSKVEKFEDALKNGGDYDSVVKVGNDLASSIGYYDGMKAGDIAQKYTAAYNDPLKKAAIDRAHTEVSSSNYSPGKESTNPDVQESLHAIGQRSRNRTYSENATERLQENLNALGFTDAKGKQLSTDGDYGPATRHAIESFQKDQGLPVDGKISPEIIEATQNRRTEIESGRNATHDMSWIPPVDSSLPGRNDDSYALRAPGEKDQASDASPFNNIHLDPYLAAVLSGDTDKADMIAREFTQSAEGQQMVQNGNELLAKQQEQEQAQSQSQRDQDQALVRSA